MAVKEVSRHIPEKLKLRLRKESGYRCAVPNCGVTSPLQFEHIEDWSKLPFKEHNFDKMIVLCANCHARVTSGEVSKSAIRAYKKNLAIISGRYSHFEMRILEAVYNSRTLPVGTVIMAATKSDLFHLGHLEKDGLVLSSPIQAAGFYKQAFDEMVKNSISRGISPVEAKRIATQLLNIPEWLILTTAEGYEFSKMYFEGEEIG